MGNTRRASSVILTRFRDGEVEVYLVERSKKLRFFGGYLAFPGGVVGPEEDVVDEPQRPHACAVRELFEETGVLFPPMSIRIGDSERDSLRDALLAPEGAAERWAGRMRGAEAVFDAFENVCTLTTPAFAPVRYETIFYHAELPANEWPSVVEGELVDGRFWSPGDAVRAWLEGDVLIAPPVLLLLRLLDEHGPARFYEAACREADELAAGKLHPIYFTPGVLLAPLETPTVPPATTTNCYIVGHRELWIVDPATPHESEQARLFAQLDRMVAERRELRGILVTHHHPDHVGAVAATARRYDLPVYAHPRTLERTDLGGAREHPIEDGARIELGRAPDGGQDWHLRAIFTPGHDQGHLAFFESRYRSAIVGDLVSTVSTIVIDPPEGHLATYLASLRRMLEEPIETLYPAHGPAARAGRGILERYLTHREARERSLVQALESGATTLGELLPLVYSDVDERLHALAARSLTAGLEKLEEEQRVQREGDRFRLAP